MIFGLGVEVQISDFGTFHSGFFLERESCDVDIVLLCGDGQDGGGRLGLLLAGPRTSLPQRIASESDRCPSYHTPKWILNFYIFNSQATRELWDKFSRPSRPSVSSITRMH